MSRTLPNETQASLKKGLCLVFQDGNNTIKAWSSLVSGKEEVYLNGELVSEGRSMNLRSGHSFQDAAGTQYQVKYITTDMMNGAIRCEFVKAGEIVKTFKTRFVKQKNYFMTRMLPMIALASMFGISISLLHIPVWLSVIAIGLFILFFFIIKSPGHLVVEESD